MECIKCKVEKELIEFHKDKSRKDNINKTCKKCSNEYRKNIYNKENNKKCRLNHIEYQKNYQKEYQKEYRKYYFKNRKLTDNLFKLKCNIASLICNSIKKNNYKKNSRTHQILGCSYDYFKNYLEIQFTKGMTWDNAGEWHLDHIYPVSLAKSEEELIQLNHYTNFQPLWALDNIKKGNKIIDNKQLKLI